MLKATRVLFAAVVLALAVGAPPARAVVTGTSSRNDLAGDGSTKTFSFTFKATDKTWVKVYVAGVLTSSTVTLNGNQDTSPGGSATLVAAPANGVTVRIQREVPATQGTALSPYSAFPSKVVEQSFDRQVMRAQEIERTHADDKTAQAAADAAQDASRASSEAALSSQIATQLQAVRGLNGYQAVTDDSTVLATGGSAARKLKDMAGDVINVVSQGAKGDCVQDDLAAFNAAVALCRSRKGGTIYLPHPSCAYRLTDRWVVGGPVWVSETDMYVRQPPDPHPGDQFNDPSFASSYNAANYTTAVDEPLCNVIGDDSIIWGDFVTGSRKAIVHYTAVGDVARNQRGRGHAQFRGIRIMGKEAISGGAVASFVYESPAGHRAPLAGTNHQVGLAYTYSPLDVQDVSFHELDVGLLTWMPYWASGSSLRSYHSNIGFYILGANASHWANLSSFYDLQWGLIISGDSVTLNQYNTEQNARDVWIPYADYLNWDGGYLESTWAADTDYGYWCGDEVNTGDTFQVGRSSISHVKFNRGADFGWRMYACKLKMLNSRIADDQTMVLDVNTHVALEEMAPPVYAAGSLTNRILTVQNLGDTFDLDGNYNAKSFYTTAANGGFIASRGGTGLLAQDAGVSKWQLYLAPGDSSYYLRDMVNSRMQLQFSPGANATAAKTFVQSKLYVADQLILGPDDTVPRVLKGVGSPAGAVSAPVGSTYVNTSGGASTTLYVKESGGAGNTGWVAK